MAKILDLLDSVNQKFDPGASGMSSTNAQDAILEAYNNPANLPVGGIVAQYIRKQSGTDYDVLWENLKIADDSTPILGGELQTDNNDIILQDAVLVEKGRIGYEATIDGVYIGFISNPANGFNPLTDGGVSAKAGEVSLSGSIVELNAFKNGTENLQVYVSPDGVLFGVVPPIPGWEETDTDNADYSFPALGSWVQITGLFITVPQAVDAGDRIDATVNLYFQEVGGRGGTIDIGIGINGVAPTTALDNVRMEAGFDANVPVSITTTTHGGIAINDTVNVFVRRSTQDHANFSPQLLGSINPSELIVSVPGVGGGAPGGDPTNLGNITGPSTVTITSSTGANTVIPGATSGPNGAGVMTEAQVTSLASKIDATGVTYEALDANGDVGPNAGQVEPGLGDPLTDGFVLSSTAAGIRSWVAPGGTDLGTSPAIDSVTITSSSGLDTVIPGATSGPSGAGVMTSAQVNSLASKIDATGVTFEALDANGDVGSGVDQVAQGNHLHAGVYADLASDNSFTAANQFLGNFNVGDPGTEVGNIQLDGISYPSVGKFNRFGTGVTAELVIHRHSTVDDSNLVFSRALSNDATHANVANGTVLGDIQFTGWGDSSYWSGASLKAVVDGVPGVSDMPTRLDFLTSADGSFAPTLRMSIRADGTVEIAGTVTVGGGVVNATKIGNWDTAFGWGDHAVQGYITAAGVTFENLDANGDVGTGATQVAQGDHLHSGVYEPDLDVPLADGYVLSSTVAGVRTWIPPGGGSGTFLGLTDTPASYTGQAGLFTRVNATEDGLEFVVGGGGGIPDAPDDTYGYLRKGPTTNSWVRGAEVFEQVTEPAGAANGSLWIDTS